MKVDLSEYSFRDYPAAAFSNDGKTVYFATLDSVYQYDILKQEISLVFKLDFSIDNSYSDDYYIRHIYSSNDENIILLSGGYETRRRTVDKVIAYNKKLKKQYVMDIHREKEDHDCYSIDESIRFDEHNNGYFFLNSSLSALPDCFVKVGGDESSWPKVEIYDTPFDYSNLFLLKDKIFIGEYGKMHIASLSDPLKLLKSKKSIPSYYYRYEISDFLVSQSENYFITQYRIENCFADALCSIIH